MGRVRFLSHPAAPYLLNAEERQGSIVLQLNLRHVFLLAVCCYNSATNLAQSWRINSGFVINTWSDIILCFQLAYQSSTKLNICPEGNLSIARCICPLCFPSRCLMVKGERALHSFMGMQWNSSFSLWWFWLTRVEVKGRLSRGRCATGSESCPSRWHCTHLPWAVFWILSQLTRRPSWHRQLLSSK